MHDVSGVDNGIYDNENDEVYEHPRRRKERLEKQKKYEEKSKAIVDNIMIGAEMFAKDYNKIKSAVAQIGWY